VHYVRLCSDFHESLKSDAQIFEISFNDLQITPGLSIDGSDLVASTGMQNVLCMNSGIGGQFKVFWISSVLINGTPTASENKDIIQNAMRALQEYSMVPIRTASCDSATNNQFEFDGAFSSMIFLPCAKHGLEHLYENLLEKTDSPMTMIRDGELNKLKK
jgi:hypothetical protein